MNAHKRAQGLSQATPENTSAESAVQKTMNAEIVKKIKKRLREAEQENDLVEKLSQDSGLLSGEKKIKRVAS